MRDCKDMACTTATSTPEDLRFAIDLLSSIGELRKDAVVAELQSQLEAHRQEVRVLHEEVGSLVRRLHATRQTVEDLKIENEWLHSLCSGESSGVATSAEPSPEVEAKIVAKKGNVGGTKRKRKAVGKTSRTRGGKGKKSEESTC